MCPSDLLFQRSPGPLLGQPFHVDFQIHKVQLSSFFWGNWLSWVQPHSLDSNMLGFPNHLLLLSLLVLEEIGNCVFYHWVLSLKQGC